MHMLKLSKEPGELEGPKTCCKSSYQSGKGQDTSFSEILKYILEQMIRIEMSTVLDSK